MDNFAFQWHITDDLAQLRKDFEELKLDIEDILHDQNDINESTRLQLEETKKSGSHV